MRPIRRCGAFLLAALVLGSTGGAGCVPRHLVIESEPAGAEVTLNYQDVGRTPLELPFTYHGKYAVTFRKAGYQAKTVLWSVHPSPARRFPFDLFTEALGGTLGPERQVLAVELEPAVPLTREEAFRRAEEARRELEQRFPREGTEGERRSPVEESPAASSPGPEPWGRANGAPGAEMERGRPRSRFLPRLR